MLTAFDGVWWGGGRVKRGERGGSAGGREFGRGEGRNSRGVVERTNEGARRERGREREEG